MKFENNILMEANILDVKKGFLIVPQGVEVINSKACFGINGQFKVLCLPSSLRFIKDSAFEDCTNLTEIYYYNSQEELYDILTKKTFQSANQQYNNVERISDRAFANTAIKEFYFSSSLEFLENDLFCSDALKNVVFPQDCKLNSFNNSIFKDCNSLTKIELPPSVTTYKNVSASQSRHFAEIVFDSFPRIYCNAVDNKDIPISTKIIVGNLSFNLGNLVSANNCMCYSLVFKKHNQIFTFIYKNNQLIEYNPSPEYFDFLVQGEEDIKEEITSLLRVGYASKLYIFEKYLKKYNLKTKIKISLINSFEREEDVEAYINALKGNKIWKNVEKKIMASSYKYVKDGIIKLGFMLGAFSDNEKLRQKASDFIFSNVVNKVGKNTILIANSFNNIKFFNNKSEEYFEFVRSNFFNIINGTIQNSISVNNYAEIIDFINNNYVKMKETCKRSKLAPSLKNFLSIYNVLKIENITEEEKDIYNELKKYPQTTKKEIQFILKTKKEMIKNEIPEFAFLPRYSTSRNLLFEENLRNDIAQTCFNGYTFNFINKYRTKNVTYAIDDRTGCANLFHIGSGITIAGMKLDNCQNLRIFNDSGKAVARSTMFINKKKGEILYNTFMVYGHTNMSLEEEREILDCFKKATLYFIREYEKENPYNERIKKVNVGTSYNGLIAALNGRLALNTTISSLKTSPATSVEGINYSLYAYSNGVKNWEGDWQEGQYILFNKKELEKIRDEGFRDLSKNTDKTIFYKTENHKKEDDQEIVEECIESEEF